MATRQVVLAGGSGFLGQALADHLCRGGYEVVVLTRSPRSGTGPVQQVEWDGRTVGKWREYLEGAKAVVNLAGRSVNCRYTPENRREIVDSRVQSVAAINRAIAACTVPPTVVVQAGSLAIYGDPGDHLCDESAPPGEGFSADTCLLWEKAFNSLETPRTRRVLLRIGFALGRNGGALQTLATLARWYLGGSAGNGKQYISWLHLHDLNRMFLSAIEREDIEGVFNATGPNPVTNAAFMHALRSTLRRPWSPPVPAWVVRIGARLMGTDASLALTGRRCAPKRLTEKGFSFTYPDLKEALRDLLI